MCIFIKLSKFLLSWFWVFPACAFLDHSLTLPTLTCTYMQRKQNQVTAEQSYPRSFHIVLSDLTYMYIDKSKAKLICVLLAQPSPIPAFLAPLHSISSHPGPTFPVYSYSCLPSSYTQYILTPRAYLPILLLFLPS